MSKSCSGKINKTRYDDLGKPMKQTSFIVKNLGENLPEKQFTIVKRSFRNPTQIHKHGPKIIFENLNSCNLNKYLDSYLLSSCRAICLQVSSYLSSFNE